MGRPKIADTGLEWVGLYGSVGGKILYGGEKLYCSRVLGSIMIVIGFQPII
jgi:hypothetical protein